MILPSDNWNAFQSFFQAHHDMNKVHLSLNKATNAIMARNFIPKKQRKLGW